MKTGFAPVGAWSLVVLVGLIEATLGLFPEQFQAFSRIESSAMAAESDLAPAPGSDAYLQQSINSLQNVPGGQELAPDNDAMQAMSGGGDNWGGDAECDRNCKAVLNDANKVCEDPKKKIECDQKKQAQVYLQCMAYVQEGWANFFNSYMIYLDAAAGAACTSACTFAIPPLSVLYPEVEANLATVCNVAGTASGAAEAANQIALRIKMNQNWAGSSTGEQVQMALAMAGVAMGILGLF